jgi:hypothetical protein
MNGPMYARSSFGGSRSFERRSIAPPPTVSTRPGDGVGANRARSVIASSIRSSVPVIRAAGSSPNHDHISDHDTA